MAAGVKSTEVETSSIVDDLIGNQDGSTVRIPADDLAALLVGAGAIAERLNEIEGQVTSGMIAVSDWATLQSLTGPADGAGGEVLDSDAGTHAQATATGYDGAMVDNAGRYSWNDTWSRWVRIGSTGLAGKASDADLNALAADVAEKADSVDVLTKAGNLAGIADPEAARTALELAAIAADPSADNLEEGTTYGRVLKTLVTDLSKLESGTAGDTATGAQTDFDNVFATVWVGTLRRLMSFRNILLSTAAKIRLLPRKQLPTAADIVMGGNAADGDAGFYMTLGDLLNFIGAGVNILSDVEGDGENYTATSVNPAAGDADRFVLWVPNTTSTTADPYLSINNDTALPIAANTGPLAAGDLVAGLRYLMQRTGGSQWRIVFNPADVEALQQGLTDLDAAVDVLTGGLETAEDNLEILETTVAVSIESLSNRVSTIRHAENVGGSATAYTATVAQEPGSASDEYAAILFRPHTDNTGNNPTLTVSSGPTMEIRTLSGGSVKQGHLRADIDYQLCSIGGLWRVLGEYGDNNSFRLTSVTGDGTDYAGAAPAGSRKVSGETSVLFSPNVTNVGDCFISIDGGPRLSIRDSSFGKLAAGSLVAAGTYEGVIEGSALRLKNFVQPFDGDALANKLTAANEMADLWQMRWSAMEAVPLCTGGRKHEAVLVQDGKRQIYNLSLGNIDRPVRLVGNDTKYLSARNLYPAFGQPITLLAESPAKLCLPTEILTIADNSLVELRRKTDAADDFTISALEGAVTREADSGDDPPACSYTNGYAGQSLRERSAKGAGDFAWMKFFDDIKDYSSIYVVEGATGATSLPGDWWDFANRTPKSAALEFLAQAQAVPANQPPMSSVIWELSQGDAGDWGKDADRQFDAYVEGGLELFDWIRTQLGIWNLPFIINPPGRWTYNASPNDRQVSALRMAQLEWTRRDPDIHIGHSPWWLPLGDYDSHPTKNGQMFQAYMDAMIFDVIIRGNVRPLGARVTEMVQSDLRSVSLRISQSEVEEGSRIFRYPEWHDFFGFWAGVDDPTYVDQAGIVSQSWVKDGSDLIVTCELDRDVPDVVFMFPSGTMVGTEQGRVISDVQPAIIGGSENLHPVLRPILTGVFSE